MKLKRSQKLQEAQQIISQLQLKNKELRASLLGIIAHGTEVRKKGVTDTVIDPMLREMIVFCEKAISLDKGIEFKTPSFYEKGLSRFVEIIRQIKIRLEYMLKENHLRNMSNDTESIDRLIVTFYRDFPL